MPLHLRVRHIKKCHWYNTTGSESNPNPGSWPATTDKTLIIHAALLEELDAESSVQGYIQTAWSINIAQADRVELTVDHIADPQANLATPNLTIALVTKAWLHIGNVDSSVALAGITTLEATIGRITGNLNIGDVNDYMSITVGSITNSVFISGSCSRLQLTARDRIGGVDINSGNGPLNIVFDTHFADQIVLRAPINTFTLKNCELRNIRLTEDITTNAVVQLINCTLKTTDSIVPVEINSTSVSTILANCTIVATGSANYAINTVITTQNIDVRFYGLTLANKPYNGPPFFSGGRINALTTGFTYNSLII